MARPCDEKRLEASRNAGRIGYTRSWYLKELRLIALGEKTVTTPQWQGLNALGKSRGWNQKLVKRTNKKKGENGVISPAVSPDMAERMMGQ